MLHDILNGRLISCGFRHSLNVDVSPTYICGSGFSESEEDLKLIPGRTVY